MLLQQAGHFGVQLSPTTLHTATHITSATLAAPLKQQPQLPEWSRGDLATTEKSDDMSLTLFLRGASCWHAA